MFGQNISPNFLLHRGTIFGPNKIPNRLTNWMCRRHFSVNFHVVSGSQLSNLQNGQIILAENTDLDSNNSWILWPTRCSSVEGTDGGRHGAYGWSNKPLPLAQTISSRFFKYRWVSKASKEGAVSKKLLDLCRCWSSYFIRSVEIQGVKVVCVSRGKLVPCC